MSGVHTDAANASRRLLGFTPVYKFPVKYRSDSHVNCQASLAARELYI